MVREQIENRGIKDPRVLAAMREVPRHLFVPQDLRSKAYTDRPLPIGDGQTISQPYIVALMTEVLSLNASSRVLEIGTGSGYQAAVLAAVAGDVYTIEIKATLYEQAGRTLRALQLDKVKTRLGDGYYGWTEQAPFDAVMITAAVDHIPPPLLRQLKDGGRLVLPLGNPFSYQNLVLVTKQRRGLHRQTDHRRSFCAADRVCPRPEKVKPVPPSSTRPPLLFAVFLISLSSLAFEVLLTRVFAISQWNHLAFMVISIALMGFAGAGTFLNLLQARDRGRTGSLASAEAPAILSLFYAAAVILAFWVLNHLPLDYFRLPVEPVQIIYLLVAYGLLAIPFFFAGLVICAAYSLVPEKTGIAYFATMTGSACGAVLPAALLPFIDEGRLIVVTALVPLLTIIPLLRSAARVTVVGPRRYFGARRGAFWRQRPSSPERRALLITAAPQTVSVHPSPYKAQAQILQLPDSRITETRNSINGLTTIVSSPYIRFAPGLSLKFGGELPPQTAVYRDGDNQLVLYTDLTPPSAEFAAFYPALCRLPAGLRAGERSDHPERRRFGHGLRDGRRITAHHARRFPSGTGPDHSRTLPDAGRQPNATPIPEPHHRHVTTSFRLKPGAPPCPVPPPSVRSIFSRSTP